MYQIKTLPIRIVFPLIAGVALATSSCTKKKAKFAVNDCVMAVDGNQVFQLNKIDGDQMLGSQVGLPIKKQILLDSKSTYVKVQCP